MSQVQQLHNESLERVRQEELAKARARLLKQLQLKFPDLSTAVIQHVLQASSEQIDRWSERLVTSTSCPVILVRQVKDEENKTLREKLGKELKAMREAEGWTQREVGQRLGWPRQTIHRAEQGIVSIDRVEQIAEALGGYIHVEARYRPKSEYTTYVNLIW